MSGKEEREREKLLCVCGSGQRTIAMFLCVAVGPGRGYCTSGALLVVLQLLM